MMDFINPHDIPDIFVGREKILSTLQYLLDKVKRNKKADIVRILLNTPGIGKTKTLEKFGTALMKCKPFPIIPAESSKSSKFSEISTSSLSSGDSKISGKKSVAIAKYALYIQITIANTDSLEEIYSKIINETISQFLSFFTQYFELLPGKWAKHLNQEKMGDYDALTLFKFITPLNTPEMIIKNPFHLISPISREIPVILHFDEFQESIHGEDKQLYYRLGTFLASILKFPILSILTGTKFTIMKTIGSNRISPLNGKVKDLVLPYLSDDDQQLFVEEVFKNPQSESEQSFLDYFKTWMIMNSGGHPRTMEYMTEKCLKELALRKDTLFGTSVIDINAFSKFFDSLELEIRETLEGLFWKSKYEKFIEENVRNIPESLQRKIILYIFEVLETDLKVPKLIINIKKYPDFAAKDHMMIEEFLSILVQAGYLLINGNYNFYIPSRYALQAFLKDWQKFLPNWYPVMQEFINNPVVHDIMYHSPQSLGLSFEVFVKYGILSLIRNPNKAFPQDYGKLIGMDSSEKLLTFNVPTAYEKRDGNVDLGMLDEISENIYVVLPAAEGIDALVKDANRILAIQITSSKDQSYNIAKIEKFHKVVNKLNADLKSNEKDLTVIPWLISLKPLQPEQKYMHVFSDYHGLVTDGALWDQMIARDLP
jgi:hypothetical protein